MAKENATANADNGPDSIVLRHLRNLDQKLDLVTERIEVLTERVGVLEGTFKILIEPMMTLHKRLDRVGGAPKPVPLSRFYKWLLVGLIVSQVSVS